MDATVFGRRIFVTLAAAAFAPGVAAAAAAAAEDAPPAAPLSAQAEDASLASLESAFWACDYVATTQGVQATPAATCRYVTEELKQRRFGGSFGQMLEWWRDNKAAEHRRLARLAPQ